MLSLKKSVSALAVACALGAIAVPAHALIATNAEFGSFDGSTGSRILTITGSETITDVDITLVFAKCDDPSLGAGAVVGDACIGTGFSFNSEIAFTLRSPLGTPVTLIAAGTMGGATPGSGVVSMHFDMGGAAYPSAPTTGTFVPFSDLGDFLGQDSLGDWELVISDTVGLDRLDYYSACLALNGQTECGGAASVPEPFSLALLGIGLAGLGFARRKTA